MIDQEENIARLNVESFNSEFDDNEKFDIVIMSGGCGCGQDVEEDCDCGEGCGCKR